MAMIIVESSLLEPLSVDDVVNHLRLSSADEEPEIEAWIVSARDMAESELSGPLINTKGDQFSMVPKQGFPLFLEWARPQPPEFVRYRDQNGWHDFTDYEFVVIGYEGRIEPRSCWPDGVEIQVRYTAGFGVYDSDVPPSIKQWMKLQIGSFSEFREASVVGNVSSVPFTDRLISRFKMVKI
ncbi:hypothetical protein LIN78_12075 [Leeia sp. TBRC 13508]|uniref:PhiE125 gp8 family phage protein n=1 Tax=Leeia speluncae TaxID=2884804 RepID=A0ABS8D7W8_9NEIS|nr:hypothetical protein [Leeia speluncae]MCB6184282.1 hypothetical protein [Leeia speluncae]